MLSSSLMEIQHTIAWPLLAVRLDDVSVPIITYLSQKNLNNLELNYVLHSIREALTVTDGDVLMGK